MRSMSGAGAFEAEVEAVEKRICLIKHIVPKLLLKRETTANSLRRGFRLI